MSLGMLSITYSNLKEVARYLTISFDSFTCPISSFVMDYQWLLSFYSNMGRFLLPYSLLLYPNQFQKTHILSELHLWLEYCQGFSGIVSSFIFKKQTSLWPTYQSGSPPVLYGQSLRQTRISQSASKENAVFE